jgi:RNase P protein component
MQSILALMADGSDAVVRARRGGKNCNSNSIIDNILNLNRGGIRITIRDIG